jgi:hypothetical protein
VFFIFSVLGYVVVTLITLLDEGADFKPGVTSLLYIYTIIRYLDFHTLYILFAGIPSSLLFCLDWEHQFIRSIAIRSSKKYYAISKVLTCFITAASSVLLSNVLLLSILSIRFPIFNGASDVLPNGYLTWSGSSGVIIYLLVKILCEAACAGFLSVTAMWLSTIVVSSFVALASPLVIYYIISTVSYFFFLPVNFHIGSLSQGTVEIYQNPFFSLLYALLVFIIASMASGYFFIENCIRRMQNG